MFIRSRYPELMLKPTSLQLGHPEMKQFILQVNIGTTNAWGVPKLIQFVCYTEAFVISRFAWPESTVSVVSETVRCLEGSLCRGSSHRSLPVLKTIVDNTNASRRDCVSVHKTNHFRWCVGSLLLGVAVLADVSLRSPRKLLIFIIKKYIYRIKVSRK